MNTIVPKVGLCKECNYPLRDLPGNRCPECGSDFDPSDPDTMNMGRPMSRMVRPWLMPMGWRIKSPALASCLMLLWGGAMLPLAGAFIYAGAALGAVVVAYQITRLSLKYVLAAIYAQPIERESRAFTIWPILFIAAMAVSGLEFDCLVWAHRPLLDRYADQQYDAPDIRYQRGPKRLGLLYFETVFVTSAGITLYLPEGYGLYASYEKPVQWAAHVSGRWYAAGWWPWQFQNRPRE